MHVVIIAIFLSIVFMVCGIILLFERNSKKTINKKAYTKWIIISFVMAGLSALFILLGYHQHHVIN